MNQQLTFKQQHILEFIKATIAKSKQPPTLTELQDFTGIKTKRGVVNHLKALEKKGLIMRTSEARGIRLSENIFGQYILDVNILGYANAGAPMVYADEQHIGVLRIDKSILPVTKDIFALEIKGDSMNKREFNGVHMSNGNYAVIAKNQFINDGDVVLAIIDQCATLKTVKKDKKLLVLYPESTNLFHKPLYLRENEDLIYGKVIAVLGNPMSKA